MISSIRLPLEHRELDATPDSVYAVPALIPNIQQSSKLRKLLPSRTRSSWYGAGFVGREGHFTTMTNKFETLTSVASELVERAVLLPLIT